MVLTQFIGIIIYPTSVYQENIKFGLHELFGAVIVNNRYQDGSQELSNLLYLYVVLVVPTVIQMAVIEYMQVNHLLQHGYNFIMR